MNADSKRAPGTYPIIGATTEVYRIALGESTWGLRGSNTRDSELTFQGESSPGRHKFKCRFRGQKPLHMRVRSLGQLRVFSLRFAGRFSPAWPLQPSQPPFFAQPGHETDRRRLAEGPQPIGVEPQISQMNADSKRAPDTYPIIGAAMEVYRIALGESTWGLRGSITRDWSIQRTICANLRHLRLIFSRKEKSNERPHPLRQGKDLQNN